jgi:hypothetical protein
MRFEKVKDFSTVPTKVAFQLFFRSVDGTDMGDLLH